MNIFNALASGSRRSLRAWRGILIFWFFSLSLAALVALPLKSAMKTGFGRSTITEKLLTGLDYEVLSDLGPLFKSLIHSVSTCLLLLLLLWILVNAFITGGLFNSLKSREEKFSTAEFFKASARNFLPFLGITLIISSIIYFISVIFIGLPLVGIISSKNPDESVPWLIMIISVSLFILISQFFVLVSDYARAWQVINEKSACFKAIGFGFSRSFGNFRSSFPMMLIIWFIQTLFIFIVFNSLGNCKPVSGTGVLVLFLISQLLFYVRLFLKVWRYGSVTCLKEIVDQQPSSETTVTM